MVLKTESNQPRRTGFTLMEMLVVVAIIVALAGIGGFFLLGALEDGKKNAAMAQVKGPLTNACQSYYMNNGQWPQSLQILLQRDQNNKGPYLENQDALIDPWGKPYQYNMAGTHNNQMKPDIWTTSNSPQDPMIGNWGRLQQQHN